jgi:membrane-associated phospholipid phosphatase
MTQLVFVRESQVLKRGAVLWRFWLPALVVSAAAVAFSFVGLDVPAAMRFWDVGRPLNSLSEGFGTDVVLFGESTVILILVAARLVRGHLPAYAQTLAIACVSSMCAYAFNDHVLKVFFGVPNPADVLHGATHRFNILLGSPNCSFPSGHMVLAGAFSGVFMRLCRVSVWPLAVLLLLAAGLLLVGDWHFLSDIIAGAFLGVSSGLLAGETWAVHSARLTGRLISGDDPDGGGRGGVQHPRYRR